jgi:hypothetical protein
MYACVQMPTNTPVNVMVVVPLEKPEKKIFLVPAVIAPADDNKFNLFTLCLPIYMDVVGKFPDELKGSGYVLTLHVHDTHPLYYQDDGISPTPPKPAADAPPSNVEASRSVVLSLYHPSYTSRTDGKPKISKHQTKLPTELSLLERGLTMTFTKQDPVQMVQKTITAWAAKRAEAAKKAR